MPNALRRSLAFLTGFIYFIFEGANTFADYNCSATNPCPAGFTQLQQLLVRVINLSVGLALIAVLGMLIFAGIKYMTSGGDAQSIKSAEQTLVWALIGFLFLAIAWVILLIIKAFTGIDVTSFNLVFPGS